MTRLLIAIAITPLYWLSYGNTAQHLWLWFVVPVFALPAISIWQGAGLGLLLGFATKRVTKEDFETQTREQFVAHMLAMLIVPLYALAAGWVLKTFFL